MNQKRLFIKPAREGLVVRDPKTLRPLPPEGAHVPDTSYWRRRIAHGDANIATPAKPKAAPKPKAKPATSRLGVDE